MGVVEGRRVVVLGGAGSVGEGICRQLLGQGAKVLVPAREQDRFEQLRALLGDPEGLHSVPGEAGHPEHAAAARDAAIAELGGVDDVVVSFGGWVQNGPLIEDDLSVWIDRVSKNNLLAHMVAAQTWMPTLLEQDKGSFLLINGSAGLKPEANAGFVSIAAAAQLMLKDVLVTEHGDAGVRINALVLMTPILSRNLTKGDPSWLSADQVGTMVAHLLSDAGASVHGESIEFGSHDQVPQL